MTGRPPGYPKTGGAKKGSVKTQTKAVKDAIRNVFFDDLGGEEYLRGIAKNDPSLFVSLLARLIPQEVRAEIDVRHSAVDLGKAMAEANERLAAMHEDSIYNALPDHAKYNPAGPHQLITDGVVECVAEPGEHMPS